VTAPTGRRFEDQVVLVVGGASGIGEATARRFDAEGAVVVVADLDEGAARAVAARLTRADGAGVDVSRAHEVDALVDGVLRQHGTLDVVVVTAGVDDPAVKDRIRVSREAGEPLDVIRHLSDEQWRRMLSINLDGTFHCLRAAARVMVPRGRGAVVTVSSSAAFDTLAGYPHYAASKAGLQALSQSVAKELAPHGIRVNTIAPGPVDTPMARRTPASVQQSITGAAAGLATADEVAESIAFLASPGAANLVGVALLSNGGRFTV
jgi:3-oxoacyl-[acyl-carrier protein] reductase